MVPKIIHYCWFGGEPLTEIAQSSISSWQKYAPDFEIRCWDESNVDISECDFVKAAYEARRWAFVSDYVRFKVLYDFGGVYMDVGSELIKGITSLLEYSPFSAIEHSTRTVSTGLVACCEASDSVIGEVLNKYRSLQFINTPDFMHSHTVNEMLTSVFEEDGFEREDKVQQVLDWTLLSSEYFDPPFGFRGYQVKPNTFSVHRCSGSWTEPKFRTKSVVERTIAPYVGRRPAQIIGRIVGEVKQEGLLWGVKNSVKVAMRLIRKSRL